MSRRRLRGWAVALALIIAFALITVLAWPDGPLHRGTGSHQTLTNPSSSIVQGDTGTSALPKLERPAAADEAGPGDPGSEQPAVSAPRRDQESEQVQSGLPEIDNPELYDVNQDRLNDLHRFTGMAREYPLPELVQFTEVNPDALEFTEDALGRIKEAAEPDLQAYRDLVKRDRERTYAAIRRNIEAGRCEEPRYTESGYPLLPKPSSPDEKWSHYHGEEGEFFIRYDREHNPEVFEMEGRQQRAAEALLFDLRRLVQLYGHEKN